MDEQTLRGVLMEGSQLPVLMKYSTKKIKSSFAGWVTAK
jgi:hypothetical protein